MATVGMSMGPPKHMCGETFKGAKELPLSEQTIQVSDVGPHRPAEFPHMHSESTFASSSTNPGSSMSFPNMWTNPQASNSLQQGLQPLSVYGAAPFHHLPGGGFGPETKRKAPENSTADMSQFSFDNSSYDDDDGEDNELGDAADSLRLDTTTAERGQGGEAVLLAPTAKRRLTRNAREQQRSKLLATQFDELGGVLRAAGRLGKVSRSCILSEAVEYIRQLRHMEATQIDQARQHHATAEATAAASTASAAAAAAVSTQANSQNAPAPLAQTQVSAEPQTRDHEEALPPGEGALLGASAGGGGGGSATPDSSSTASSSSFPPPSSSVHSSEPLTRESFRCAFADSGLSMAVASTDGCFTECNSKFVEESAYTKEELHLLTIFNLTAASDLQLAFSQVSQMIRSPTAVPHFEVGAMLKFNRERGRLVISLVRDENFNPLHFAVSILPTYP